jgi:hypothetical protein
VRPARLQLRRHAHHTGALKSRFANVTAAADARRALRARSPSTFLLLLLLLPLLRGVRGVNQLDALRRGAVVECECQEARGRTLCVARAKAQLLDRHIQALGPGTQAIWGRRQEEYTRKGRGGRKRDSGRRTKIGRHCAGSAARCDGQAYSPHRRQV